MNTEIPKYDPEDLESLMAHKPFKELYPEEKSFVLQHMESPEEYESMRAMLLRLQEKRPGDHIQPDAALKEDLMALFATEKKRGFFVWLNGMVPTLFVSEQPWFRQPALAYAMGIGLLIFGGWFMLREDDHELFAQHEAAETEEVHTAEDINEKEETAEFGSEVETTVNDNSIDGSTEDAGTENFTPAPELILEEEVVFADAHVAEDANESFDAEIEEADFDFRTDDLAVKDLEKGRMNEALADEISLDMEEETESFDVATDIALKEEAYRESFESKARYDSIGLGTGADGLAIDNSTLNFTVSPTMMDSSVGFTIASEVDQMQSNTYIPATELNEDLLSTKAATIESVAIAGAEESTDGDLQTRGLDFAYAPGTSASVPVKEYDELLDLLYTSW